jgi:hypothetical protein
MVTKGNFTAIREYTKDVDTKLFDINAYAGPIIIGIGTTATGFTLGGAFIHGTKKEKEGLLNTIERSVTVLPIIPSVGNNIMCLLVTL